MGEEGWILAPGSSLLQKLADANAVPNSGGRRNIMLLIKRTFGTISIQMRSSGFEELADKYSQRFKSILLLGGSW